MSKNVLWDHYFCDPVQLFDLFVLAQHTGLHFSKVDAIHLRTLSDRNNNDVSSVAWIEETLKRRAIFVVFRV